MNRSASVSVSRMLFGISISKTAPDANLCYVRKKLNQHGRRALAPATREDGNYTSCRIIPTDRLKYPDQYDPDDPVTLALKTQLTYGIRVQQSLIALPLAWPTPVFSDGKPFFTCIIMPPSDPKTVPATFNASSSPFPACIHQDTC
jgi:hypothetical protein